MASLQPIDVVETPQGARARFVPVTFTSALLTAAQLLTGGPILVTPSLPFVAPVDLEIPKFIKAAKYFRVLYQFISADSFLNTVLGGANFIPNEIKAVEFNGNAGSTPIAYDGKNAYDNFSFPGRPKYIQVDELRRIRLTNAAVSVAHNLNNLATTTAFAPDVVGATNQLFFAMETEVYAVY